MYRMQLLYNYSNNVNNPFYLCQCFFLKGGYCYEYEQKNKDLYFGTYLGGYFATAFYQLFYRQGKENG